MSECWAPATYQKTIVKWLVQHPAAGIFAEPGLRKTSCTLAAFQALRKAGGAHRALIIAPKRVCELVWSDVGEVGKWSQFAGLKTVFLHGPAKDDLLEEDADLYAINPDGLAWLTAEGRLTQLLRRGVDLLVIDELSAFKHVKTKRMKLLKPFLGRFKRRWGLTGSPASNGLLDLFGQAYVLDLGKALGPYITSYRNEFFTPSGFGGYTWKPQQDAEPRIYARLAQLALSFKAEDHLDLPPLIEQDLFVTLPPEARRVYTELEEELIAALDDGVVTAANAAVASGKCRQVASGGLYVERPGAAPGMNLSGDENLRASRVTKHLHQEKTEALIELVEELQGAPLLVAYEFDHDLERIRTGLGDVPVINGRTTGKEAVELTQAWNRGELPVLCGHPQAMGHGLNLQECGSHLAWYSLTWNLELYDQMNRRLYRSGQRSRVVVHRLLARGTLDEVVAKALGSKRRGQDALFTALKDLRRSRRS